MIRLGGRGSEEGKHYSRRGNQFHFLTFVILTI
jgi:hypothetical protein